MDPLLTFGHGTATEEEIVDLLNGAAVERIVDVRRFPGSRRHPHVAAAELERWLPTAGIAYRWEPRLGGRRSAPRGTESVDVWWQVDAFRAYAAHARTSEFREALGELLAQAVPGTAVMCSESLWWRCHRRLIADVLVLLHHRPVLHLGHDGRLTEHRPSVGARVTADGLVYDRAD